MNVKCFPFIVLTNDKINSGKGTEYLLGGHV